LTVVRASAPGPPTAGERAIHLEECSEDTPGAGILALTDRRTAFDKTQSRMLDPSKRFGDTVPDIPLRDVTRVWNEGLFIKKSCASARRRRGEDVQAWRDGHGQL